jgi:hypothetical protein
LVSLLFFILLSNDGKGMAGVNQNSLAASFSLVLSNEFLDLKIESNSSTFNFF